MYNSKTVLDIANLVFKKFRFWQLAHISSHHLNSELIQLLSIHSALKMEENSVTTNVA